MVQATDGKQQSNIEWAVDTVEVTKERPPPVGLDKVIQNPGAPRASKVITADHPHGSPYQRTDRTALQSHMDFWDFDGDGVVYPWDTFRGFNLIGLPLILCPVAVLVIHQTFSLPTVLPQLYKKYQLRDWQGLLGILMLALFFPLFLAESHWMKHGSDSESFDTEGRYVPEKYEEVFSKNKKGPNEGLELRDIWRTIGRNANNMDPVGWVAGFLEWATTYWLFATPKRSGRGYELTRDSLRGVFDGTIFYERAGQMDRLKKITKSH